MAITIEILNAETLPGFEGGPSTRKADIKIGDGTTFYLLTVGGLPLSGSLQALLDADSANLWRRAQEVGVSAVAVRTLAANLLDKQQDAYLLLFRANLKHLFEYTSNLATKHNNLLTWLGTQTTIINRNQLPTFAHPTPTLVEVRSALKVRINAGEADA